MNIIFNLTLFIALVIPFTANSQMAGQPENSYVYGSKWYCKEGYIKKGNRCAGIFENMAGGQPENSYVYGSKWYCKEGYIKKGNRCASIFENMAGGQPENSYVYGSKWYCKEGYIKKGSRCASIFENMAKTNTDKNKTSTKKTSKTISSNELQKLKQNVLLEKNKRIKLERKLKELQKKQYDEEKIIEADNEVPVISTFVELNNEKATISGRVTDNIFVSEVIVADEVQKLSKQGVFKTQVYVPRSGLKLEIIAYDKKGNKASEIIKIERNNIKQASGPSFVKLNPTRKGVVKNPNGLALIIGVANYAKTNANALYADNDAQQFYDYARMKLGISPENIKELLNDKADRVDISLAIEDWIRRSSKYNKTDIFIFFAGHGLASQDGKDLFLLPYDGTPRLLERSAIKRKELFKNVQKANPRSVTVFLDTCYSGTSRGTNMLVASRPIMIKAKEQSIPNNFTVFSAAAGDQTSKPLEEAKHGIFSYFLMKGMEGDADANNDNKITAHELHAYVKENVTQQSSGSQTPELQGDKDRVLVQFN